MHDLETTERDTALVIEPADLDAAAAASWEPAPEPEPEPGGSLVDVSTDADVVTVARELQRTVDAVPAQLSTLSVATLRAELAETQRQVEMIADAFAQAVDVISESLSPSESRIRETVASVVSRETTAVREAIAADWSRRTDAWAGQWAGQMDQGLTRQSEALAAALAADFDARWHQLGERLAAEIRELSASLAARSAEAAALASLPGRVAAEIDWQPLEAGLSARLSEWAAKISNEIREFRAAVAAASPEPSAPVDVEAAVSTALTRQSADWNRSLETQLSHQVSGRMDAQLAGIREWLDGRIGEWNSEFREQLRPLVENPPEATTSVDVEVVANAVRAIATELTDLRQQIVRLGQRPPEPAPTIDLKGFAEPLSAAFEKLDQAMGERMNGLFEAVREELSSMQDVRTRAIRRELDRVLYIATGLFGVLSGGFLWLLLR